MRLTTNSFGMTLTPCQMSQGLVNGIKNNAQFLVLRMIGE